MTSVRAKRLPTDESTGSVTLVLDCARNEIISVAWTDSYSGHHVAVGKVESLPDRVKGKRR